MIHTDRDPIEGTHTSLDTNRSMTHSWPSSALSSSQASRRGAGGQRTCALHSSGTPSRCLAQQAQQFERQWPRLIASQRDRVLAAGPQWRRRRVQDGRQRRRHVLALDDGTDHLVPTTCVAARPALISVGEGQRSSYTLDSCCSLQTDPAQLIMCTWLTRSAALKGQFSHQQGLDLQKVYPRRSALLAPWPFSLKAEMWLVG